MQQLAVSFQISMHKAWFYLYSEVTDNNRVKRKTVVDNLYLEIHNQSDYGKNGVSATQDY